MEKIQFVFSIRQVFLMVSEMSSSLLLLVQFESSSLFLVGISLYIIDAKDFVVNKILFLPLFISKWCDLVWFLVESTDWLLEFKLFMYLLSER